MQEVGRFSLYNNGGFVACIKFVYMGDDGMEHEVRATEGYPVLQTREASPGDCGVPDGSLVWLKVGVAAGYDNKSQRCFIYRAGNQQVADFAISGTTLDNSLQFKGLRTPAPQELKPMFFNTPPLLAKASQKLVTKTGVATNILKSPWFKVINKPAVIVGTGAVLKTAAEFYKDKGKDDSVKQQSAYDGDAVVSEAEFAELVPQGLVADITSQLITTLAPITSDLVRVLLPLSAEHDDAQLSAQGLLDQMVNTIIPALLPSIGKMAVLLTQSVQEEQAQGIEPPAQASAQPYALPEAWRATASLAD